MINIIIRTSWRPQGFAAALRSIDLPDVNIIVGYDAVAALTYLNLHGGLQLIDLTAHRKPEVPYFYNLYLNHLMPYAQPGHIIFLDDDDTFIPSALSKLAPRLQPDISYIVPFVRRQFQKPTAAQMQTRILMPGYVGLPSIVLSTTHAQHVYFTASELADYAAARQLPAPQWLNIPLVNSPYRSRGATEA